MELFAISVHSSYMPNYMAIKDQIVNDIKQLFILENDTSHPHSRGDSQILMPGKNNFNLNNIQNGNLILDYLNEQAKIYWKTLKYSDEYEPYLLYTWTSFNPRGGSWASHNHAPTTISGCFYLDASPEQGNIVFENPLELVLGYQPFTQDTGDRFFEHEEPAETGKLLLFPGYLKHRVQPNTIDKPRMIIGFDFSYRVPGHS